jgi:thiamine-monophosphate kinase
MEQPQPRVALGLALRGIATSAIDVSDGLLGDLGHVLRRSGVGAVVDVDAVPRSAVLAAQSLAWQRECTLAGGDDYDCFAPRRARPPARAGCHAHGLRAVGAARRFAGRQVPHTFGSFDHFRS